MPERIPVSMSGQVPDEMSKRISILVSVVSVRVHACPTASGARDRLRIHAGPAASGARDRVRFHTRPAASGACEKVRVRAGQLQPELAIWLGSVRAQIQLELAMSSWHSTHKLADKYSKDEEWRREEDKKRKREAEKKRGGVAFLLKTRDPYLVGGGKTCQGAPHCGADSGAIATFLSFKLPL